MKETLTHGSGAFVDFRHVAFAEPYAHAFRRPDVERFRLPAPSAAAD
ncbi:hypothetical protein [Streptomyces sp. NPDC058758]